MYATTYEVPGTLTSNVNNLQLLQDLSITLSFTLQNTPQTDDENPYMVPASNEHALYSQLSQIRVNYIKRDSIKSVENKND